MNRSNFFPYGSGNNYGKQNDTANSTLVDLPLLAVQKRDDNALPNLEVVNHHGNKYRFYDDYNRNLMYLYCNIISQESTYLWFIKLFNFFFPF